MKQPYQIRIEPEMKAQLQKLADKNDTSVNHEIRQAIKKRLQEK
jgi:predicted transcriptional regulator